LGPKPSEENKRDFDEETLNAGKTIIGLQAGQNKGASQAGQNMGAGRKIILGK
jgi:transgelin